MKVRVILLVVLFLLSSLNLRVGHAQIDATLNPTPTPSERSPTSAPAFTGPVQSSTARPTFVPGTSCTATDDAIALIGDGACNDYSNSNTTDMNNEACGWDGGDCCENTCISAELDCGSRNYFCLDPNEERSPYASCEGIGVGTWIADGFCDEHNNNEDCVWDGGDCCPCTCEDGWFHNCPESNFNCQDPTTECEPPGTDTPEAAPITNEEPTTAAPSPSLPPVREMLLNHTGSVAAGAVSTFAVGGVTVVSAGSMVGSSGTGVVGVAFGDGGVGSAINQGQGTLSGGDATTNISGRQPSATLAFVLMAQLQFLATLSLVDFNMDEEPLLAEFSAGLRWVNLWWPTGLADDLTCSYGDGGGQLGASVFVENLLLFIGALLLIFLIHIVVVSGVEAKWLSKKRANRQLKAAESRGISTRELTLLLLGGRATRQTHPMGQSNGIGAGIRPPLLPLPPLNAALSGRSSIFGEDSDVDSDEEEEAVVLMRGGSSIRWQTPLRECRKNSTSAWLHFPHIELVFLLFAFEGAVASQLSAIRHAQCAWMVYAAVVALLLYPVLMFVMVWRIVGARVCADHLIVFIPNEEQNEPGDERLRTSIPVSSTFMEGWKRDGSLFAWASKGHWETAKTTNRQARQEADWFRIGFEPLYTDFTQSGAWFVVFTLAEWAAIACIGVVFDNSVLQLSLFGGVHTVSFIYLAVLRPFANRVINFLAAGLVGADAVSMGLMAASAGSWKGTLRAEHINKLVMLVQLVALCVLVVPVYVDTLAGIMGNMSNTIGNVKNKTSVRESQLTDEERDGQAFVRLYIRHVWLRTWRTMLRYNLLACGRETFEGIRIPRPTGGVACRRNPGCCLSVAKNNNGHVEIEHAPRRHTSSNNVVGIHGDPLNVGSSAHDVGGVRRAPSPIIIFGE